MNIKNIINENDFTQEQLNEIHDGLRKGLSEKLVLSYAKTHFTAERMELIKNLYLIFKEKDKKITDDIISSVCNPELSISHLEYLIYCVDNHLFNIVKLLANPGLNINRIQDLLYMYEMSDITDEQFKIICNPEYSLETLCLIHSCFKDKKISQKTISQLQHVNFHKFSEGFISKLFNFVKFGQLTEKQFKQILSLNLEEKPLLFITTGLVQGYDLNWLKSVINKVTDTKILNFLTLFLDDIKNIKLSDEIVDLFNTDLNNEQLYELYYCFKYNLTIKQIKIILNNCLSAGEMSFYRQVFMELNSRNEFFSKSDLCKDDISEQLFNFVYQHDKQQLITKNNIELIVTKFLKNFILNKTNNLINVFNSFNANKIHQNTSLRL